MLPAREVHHRQLGKGRWSHHNTPVRLSIRGEQSFRCGWHVYQQLCRSAAEFASEAVLPLHTQIRTKCRIQVWPVIHSKLVKRGLKSVPAEEVRSMHLHWSICHFGIVSLRWLWNHISSTDTATLLGLRRIGMAIAEITAKKVFAHGA